MCIFPFCCFFFSRFGKSNTPKTTSAYVQSTVNTARLFTCSIQGNYWSIAHNRRKFFVDFATQKGFDPLVAANWKNVQRREIIKQVKRESELVWTEELNLKKIGYGPLHFYKGNIQEAINDSFPGIGVHISLLFFLFYLFDNFFLRSINPKKTSKYVQLM